AMIPFAQGVGFAIPAHTVKRIIEQIQENGRVVRPWLGISGVDMNPAIARRYNLPLESGVLLVEIGRESPAYEAGLRVGDILVQLGDQEVKDMKDLVLALSKLSIGDVLKIALVRMGRKYDTSVRLVEAPSQVLPRRRR
ncbi:MAG: PDZ domain-containing protein, partial [Thaumarchaeota archaeon]|nr:PDZ domain-containing protein [Nitrososphaerota archaeon]